MIWKWIVVGSVSMTVEARWRQRQARRGRGAGLEHGSRPGTRSVDAWQPLGKRWTIRWRRRERSSRASMLSCDKHPRLASAMTPRLTRCRPAVIFAMPVAGAPANPARAADIVLKDAASMAGAVMWLSSGAPGLVLAVVRGEESVVLGYGETRPGSKVEPNGRSILRMGSIAKVMAAPPAPRQRPPGTSPS